MRVLRFAQVAGSGINGAVALAHNILCGHCGGCGGNVGSGAEAGQPRRGLVFVEIFRLSTLPAMLLASGVEVTVPAVKQGEPLN